MHFREQVKSSLSSGLNFKIRPNQNKSHNYKEYEDEQESLALKGSDSAEIRDLKNKMKTVMVKLANTKKQKQQLHKENKTLSQEVLTLQNNLRQMVSGFSNTSSNFPIHNQLASKIAQFYKCDCLDIFFDLLSPEELNMKGVIFFYYQAFTKTQQLIEKYFQPTNQSILKTGCFTTLDGPIMNVLRKAYQTNYMEILEKIVSKNSLQNICDDIQKQLNIDDNSQQAKQTIITFLKKVCELLLCCMICDPPMYVDFKNIGKKVKFNPLKNDPFDGFIKAKEDCWVVLPQIRKINEQGEPYTKSMVFHIDYDLIN